MQGGRRSRWQRRSEQSTKIGFPATSHPPNRTSPTRLPPSHPATNPSTEDPGKTPAGAKSWAQQHPCSWPGALIDPSNPVCPPSSIVHRFRSGRDDNKLQCNSTLCPFLSPRFNNNTSQCGDDHIKRANPSQHANERPADTRPFRLTSNDWNPNKQSCSSAPPPPPIGTRPPPSPCVAAQFHRPELLNTNCSCLRTWHSV